jgi:hypothetical protein
MDQEIAEVLLYELTLIAARDRKIAVTMPGIDVHNVPKHGFAPDLDHGLGPGTGLFRQPCTESPGQNNNFHDLASCTKGKVVLPSIPVYLADNIIGNPCSKQFGPFLLCHKLISFFSM